MNETNDMKGRETRGHPAIRAHRMSSPRHTGMSKKRNSFPTRPTHEHREESKGGKEVGWKET